MTLQWKTITRPNGTPGHREQVTGLQAYVAWVAIIVSIIGAVILDRIAIEHRLDQNAADTFRNQSALVNTIKLEVIDAANKSDYVRRPEWAERNRDMAERLERIESYQRHSLSVLERLPGAKETR